MNAELMPADVMEILKKPYIAITHGMRGYFAVLIDYVDGEPMPFESGIGSYATPEEAHAEARAWAEAEEIDFIA